MVFIAHHPVGSRRRSNARPFGLGSGLPPTHENRPPEDLVPPHPRGRPVGVSRRQRKKTGVDQGRKSRSCARPAEPPPARDPPCDDPRTASRRAFSVGRWGDRRLAVERALPNSIRGPRPRSPNRAHPSLPVLGDPLALTRGELISTLGGEKRQGKFIHPTVVSHTTRAGESPALTGREIDDGA